MERAGRVLGNSRIGRACLAPEEMARTAWPLAVGKRLAARTGAVWLLRTTLIVEVPDDTWKRQLFTLRGQIMRRLQAVIGEGMVTDVEFRVAVPRPVPVRVETLPATVASADEADHITDPVLRRLYVAARKRASA